MTLRPDVISGRNFLLIQPPAGHIIHEQAFFACEGCLWPQADRKQPNYKLG